ncbi:MAG: hypothetical protein KI791_14645 [Cyclobacteriaceae bacterium]|nr:hypothetical protein [Cyclobacteriaceae bacterium SS2]
MTKKLLLLTLLSMIGIRVIACDVCGCSLSGLYFGFVPVQNTHFVGVKYNMASFDAFIDNDDYYFEDEYSEDTYQRFELVGRFSLGSRIQIRYMVPYLNNVMDGSHQHVRSHGVGDPVALVYYNLLNPTNTGDETIMQSLSIGGGLKFPLGDYDKTDQEEIINRNFQLGSGSLDYLVSTNYTLRYQKMGVNAEGSYKINSANKHGYRFGNQANISANLFYYVEGDKYSLVPFVGAYYEKAGYHSNNEIREGNTGGSSWLGTIGIQFFTGAFTFNAQYQMPVKQQFNTDEFATIEGGDRLSLAVYLSFSSGK